MTLQSLLSVELPLIQAPMAGVQGSALAVAVSNAGGLGSLPCALLSPEALRSKLAALTSRTDKPYNVNFFCHNPPTPSAERESAWRATLAPYYREFGLDTTAIPEGSGRTPSSAEAAEIRAEFRPPVVSFHFGLPSPELLARVRSWGSKILSSATTVDEARWLQARGVDAIIAQGVEAGGHPGRHAGPRAADRERREDAGDRRRRHRGRSWGPGCPGPRGCRRAGRDGVPALPGGDHERCASHRAQERGRPPRNSPSNSTRRLADGHAGRGVDKPS